MDTIKLVSRDDLEYGNTGVGFIFPLEDLKTREKQIQISSNKAKPTTMV